MRSPLPLPVIIRFEAGLARPAAWGRLAELTASSALLSTRAALSKGDNLFLSFEFNAESFKRLSARVAHEETDSDGYRSAYLRFADEVEKRRLARVLADLLARSP